MKTTFSPEFAEVALYILLTGGVVAGAAILWAFIVFLVKAMRAVKLVPVARCQHCAEPLPARPSAAVVSDDKTMFVFTCATCAHKTCVKTSAE